MHPYSAIIFDYGGTLDTFGRHWANFMFDAYTLHSYNITWPQFYDAYVAVERRLGQGDIVSPDWNLRRLLETKVRMQTEQLSITVNTAAITDTLLTTVGSNIARIRPLLRQLQAAGIPLVLVSNYYGNLRTVLNDFQLDNYFTHIVESAAVGIRKPDPAIFQYALNLPPLNAMHPSSLLCVGDSEKNDILPARSLGMQPYKITSYEDFQALGRIFPSA